MLINLPGTTAADNSDKDAKPVTGVDCISADDELRLGSRPGFDLGGGSGCGSSGVPAAKQKTDKTYRKASGIMRTYSL